MTFNPRDHYFKKAKKENFAARSVYKLEEIDQKYHIFKSGNQVLDLGATPGSWSQYAHKAIAPSGKLLSVDLNPIQVKLERMIFWQGDFHELPLNELMEQHQLNPLFDVIISDMAPKTTGIKSTDQARSVELCETALAMCDTYLKPHGHFVCKLFHCDEFKNIEKQIKSKFKTFYAMKPDSTRKSSKEIFLIGKGRV